jgi:tartrate dehydrogenase/decarboxylase / D-malate dehydrogenase
MTSYRIALVPGDNIGPEVIAEGRRVLDCIEELGYCSFSYDEFPWGAGDYLKTGRAAPVDVADRLRGYNAIYLGAQGDPARVPEDIPAHQLMHAMRKGLQLFANVRPIRWFPGTYSPLRNTDPIDFVIVRENTEGEYSGMGGRIHEGTPDEMAFMGTVVTRRATERIMRHAFELARKRGNEKYVHCVTKAGALKLTMSLWDEIFVEIAAEYPDVRTTKGNVDATSMYIITRPHTFDVMVATNLMGDILSDEAASVSGSIGLAPSANLSVSREVPSMFEPIHGSAPDIAGKGIANPLATILAGAMMLDWLGETAAAALVDRAVISVLKKGQVRTPDLGGNARTTDMTAAVIQELRS